IGDTIAVAEGPETFFFAEGDARPPLARQSFVGLRDETLIVGDADVLGYREYSLDGTLRRTISVPQFSLAFSRSEFDAIRAELSSRPTRREFGHVHDQMAA